MSNRGTARQIGLLGFGYRLVAKDPDRRETLKKSCPVEEEVGGEGKDSNLRMAFATAASKLAAALANSDLSTYTSLGVPTV
jgi:dsRNA-specific ribonuclease